MDYTLLFIIIVSFWYVGYISFAAHLYFGHYKEHESKYQNQYIDKIPSMIPLPQLSLMLYHRKPSPLFLSTIYFLIYKNILVITKDEKNRYLEFTTKMDKLSDSQKVIVNLLVNIVGDNQKVSFNTLNNFCNGPSGKSEFSFNYYMWEKAVIKETSKREYYEEIRCYGITKLVVTSSIFLSICNFVFKFNNLFAYLTLLFAYLLRYMFFRIHRRTEYANNEYHKWLSYKRYLNKNNSIEIEESKRYPYLIYGTLLKVENMSSKLHLNNNEDLDEIKQIITKCITLSKVVGGFKWNLK